MSALRTYGEDDEGMTSFAEIEDCPEHRDAFGKEVGRIQAETVHSRTSYPLVHKTGKAQKP